MSANAQQLINAKLSYAGRDERDEVSSYTAIRSVGVEGGRFQLNDQAVCRSLRPPVLRRKGLHIGSPSVR